VRWEIKQSFDGQFYQEYSYQNRLKLDHFFQVMMKKIWCVFMLHSVVRNWMSFARQSPSEISLSFIASRVWSACIASLRYSFYRCPHWPDRNRSINQCMVCLWKIRGSCLVLN